MSQPTALVIAGALALAGAPPALADGASSNWAGYAVHGAGVQFTSVSAAWQQPGARCHRGHRTYSAVWVGTGGFATNSRALEQVGTEEDCKASGRPSTSAWYELVPAPSRPVRMTIRPGDSMAARVTVVGNRVTVALFDLTRHSSFQKTLQAHVVDASSGEWIVEAPSECFNATTCATLPLANFGSTTFAQAQAQSLDGHAGTVSNPRWTHTRIRLLPNGRRFVVYRGSGRARGAATPSALSPDGSSFSVFFSRVRSPLHSPFAPAVDPGRLLHPGRWR